jgi:hypothetical protein
MYVGLYVGVFVCACVRPSAEAARGVVRVHVYFVEACPISRKISEILGSVLWAIKNSERSHL